MIEADDGAPKQLELVPSTEMPAAFFCDGENGPRGDFTAARLFSQHPDKYRAIIGLVAEGSYSIRAICRALRISKNTVQAVCAREGIALAKAKDAVLKDYKLVERLALERLVDDMDSLKPEALAMLLGIVRDKIATMEGTPTTIVGHLHAQAPIDDINKFIDALPGVDGNVIESETEEGAPHTGVGEGNDSAMARSDEAGDLGETEAKGGSND
ncbi:MAG: hypothetical protein ACFUZC_04870 [Chthoniobacteraceae bacterium]